MKVSLCTILLVLMLGVKSMAQCVSTCSTYARSEITFTTFPNTGTDAVPMFSPTIDDGITPPVPIGFNFTYYCTTYSTVLVCSNGFLQFDIGSPPNLAFSNPAQMFPDATSPNGIVALNMGDLDPNMGGTITYTTVGVSPNQKFILTYSNVPMWNFNSSTNTGQIILYEGTNIIEIHTGAVNVSNTSFYPGTQGIENELGTMGSMVPGRAASTWSATNSAYRWAPYTPVPPSFISGNNLFCQGAQAVFQTTPVSGALSYTWSAPSGWTGSSSTTVLSATVGSTGNLSVSANYTCGTSSPAIISVTSIPAPIASIQSATPAVMCSGKFVTIQTAGGVQYTVEPGGIIGTPPFSVQVNAPTIFSVTSENSSGCISINTATVSIQTNPTPTITVNSGTVCLGESFSVQPSGANSYSISGGFFVVSPTLGLNIYTVTGISPLSCISDPVFCQVNAVALPTVNASTNRPVICTKESATLTASGANSYTWSNNAITPSTIVSPTITSTYTVTGESNGCKDAKLVTQLVNICQGLQEVVTEDVLRVYPNPAGHNLFLETVTRGTDIRIINTQGQIIREMRLEDEKTEIELGEFSNGLYYIFTLNLSQNLRFKINVLH